MAALRMTSFAGLCANFTKSLVLSRAHYVQRHCCCTFASSRSTNLLPSNQLTHIPHRNKSWLNTLSADRLWKSMTALTGKAQTKARGKRPQKRYQKDLNRGRSIGEGKAGIQWSALARPTQQSRGRDQDDFDNVLVRPKEIDVEREQYLADVRNREGRRKKRKLTLEEKGWTSAGWGGRSLGPPDPIPGENFEGFKSKVIFVKNVYNMTASVGRKKSVMAMVIVGNQKGALGYALGKGSSPMAALRKAKNKAATRLQYMERYDNHTISHDIEYRFISTRIRMKKENRGYGLKCHRVIREICYLAGITDIYAKVYGSKNPLNIAQCAIKGLASQETYEQIAKRTGLHVVEFQPQCGALPIVLASPEEDKLREDVDEIEWDKELPLEKKEIQKLEDKKYSNPFNRPGKLLANPYSASNNPKPETYTSQRDIA
ncbi:small ribosomal subunit protein uS5m-like [Amphiura filiformis]|uniref:small ribosomal subunit protein uS5m-like n=1 Tax=Amphiura filiformis TaxID=82378 RepID=UPI003B21236F